MFRACVNLDFADLNCTIEVTSLNVTVETVVIEYPFTPLGTIRGDFLALPGPTFFGS